MERQLKISVTDEYALALGKALYCFNYLEKQIIDIIVKINPNHDMAIRGHETASEVAKVFKETLTDYPQAHCQTELNELCSAFFVAIDPGRNKLLHAKPCTDTDGRQVLIYFSQEKELKTKTVPALYIEWPLEDLEAFMFRCEDLAIQGNSIYYNQPR